MEKSLQQQMEKQKMMPIQRLVFDPHKRNVHTLTISTDGIGLPNCVRCIFSRSMCARKMRSCSVRSLSKSWYTFCAELPSHRTKTIVNWVYGFKINPFIVRLFLNTFFVELCMYARCDFQRMKSKGLPLKNPSIKCMREENPSMKYICGTIESMARIVPNTCG